MNAKTKIVFYTDFGTYFLKIELKKDEAFYIEIDKYDAELQLKKYKEYFIEEIFCNHKTFTLLNYTECQKNYKH